MEVETWQVNELGDNFLGNKEFMEKVCEELCLVRLVQECVL